MLDQSKAINIGTTILSFRDSANDEPRALEPGEEVIVNVPTKILIVANRSSTEDGWIQVWVEK